MATYNEAVAALEDARRVLPDYGKLVKAEVRYDSYNETYVIFANFEQGSVKERLADPIIINTTKVFMCEDIPAPRQQMGFPSTPTYASG